MAIIYYCRNIHNLPPIIFATIAKNKEYRGLVAAQASNDHGVNGVMDLLDCGFGIGDFGYRNMMATAFSFFKSEIQNLISEIA